MKKLPSRRFANCLPITAAFLALSSVSSFGALIFSSSVGVQPGNVGTITLTQINGTTVDVLLDLNDTTDPAPKYGLINTGGPHTPFAFSISGIDTGVNALFTQPAGGFFSFGILSLDTGGGANTPYGTYGVAINSSSGNGSSNAYYGDLQFQLTRAGGLSINDFVVNADGYYFSADLTNGTNTGAQAWRGPGTPTTTDGGRGVPDGGTTLVTLGIALLGLGSMRKFICAKA